MTNAPSLPLYPCSPDSPQCQCQSLAKCCGFLHAPQRQLVDAPKQRLTAKTDRAVCVVSVDSPVEMRSQTSAPSRKRTREVRRSHKPPQAVRYRDDDLDHDGPATSDEEMHSDDDDNDSLHGRPPSKQFKLSSRSRSRSPPTPAVKSRGAVKSGPVRGGQAPDARLHDDAAHLAATIRRQQMKDAFQPWVMQVRGNPYLSAAAAIR